MSDFLTQSELDKLTGIARGRDGKSRDEMQVDQLRKMGIVCRVNFRGAPIVTWAAVDGIKEVKHAKTWQSNLTLKTKTA